MPGAFAITENITAKRLPLRRNNRLEIKINYSKFKTDKFFADFLPD